MDILLGEFPDRCDILSSRGEFFLNYVFTQKVVPTSQLFYLIITTDAWWLLSQIMLLIIIFIHVY